MAKSKEQPKPIYPLRHEFVASLDNFLQQAGMLRDAAHQALNMDLVDKRVADLLRERVKAFDAARFGEQ